MWPVVVASEAAKGIYFAAHFAQLRGRRGEPKALGALRHDILVACYHIVRDRGPSESSVPTGNARATPADVREGRGAGAKVQTAASRRMEQSASTLADGRFVLVWTTRRSRTAESGVRLLSHANAVVRARRGATLGTRPGREA